MQTSRQYLWRSPSWASYGVTQRVPVTQVSEQSRTRGASHCSPSSRARAPKTQPIQVHTGAQQIRVPGHEGTWRRGTKWQPGCPGKQAVDVSHFELSGVVWWEADACNPSQPPAAVLSRAPCSRHGLLLNVATWPPWTLSDYVTVSSQNLTFRAPSPGLAPRTGLHAFLSVKIPTSRIKGLVSRAARRPCSSRRAGSRSRPGQPLKLSNSEFL